MDHRQFWEIIAKACRSDLRRAEEWDTQLRVVLEALPADEIVEWDRIFDRLAVQAYTVDLWAAAYLINGGASDDGFYYFRCWLIGMGQNVYEAAIADPDSLATVVDPRIDAEAEIYAAAWCAWRNVTGQPDTAPYPVLTERAELKGQNWDFDDTNEMRRRLPRLVALYLD